jgi:hypothetical protein
VKPRLRSLARTHGASLSVLQGAEMRSRLEAALTGLATTLAVLRIVCNELDKFSESPGVTRSVGVRLKPTLCFSARA